MRKRPQTVTARCVLIVAVTVVPLQGQTPPEAEVRKAYELSYNLDFDEAAAVLDQAVKRAPGDAATHRALASLTWHNILFQRGAFTVEDYLGATSKPQVTLTPPPPALAQRFRQHAERAAAISEQRLRAAPRDVNAWYELGTSVGLLASYIATVEGRIVRALGAARRAYDAHEKVLELDARRKDAGLIVGTYRYLVSTLSLPMRVMAYVVGFGGGREQGLRQIEEAVAHRGEAQVEAQFALVILYNREGRYDDALRVLAALQRQFPRNRLLWIEAGATARRAKRFAQAEATLTEGLARLAADRRPRAFGEERLWYYERGAARGALRRAEDAAADLTRALASPGRIWVEGRAHLERGKLSDLAGDRTRARAEYQRAIPLCEKDNDPRCANEAKRLAAK